MSMQASGADERTPGRVRLERNGQVHPSSMPPDDVMAHFEDILTSADDAVYEVELALTTHAMTKAVNQLGDARRYHRKAAKVLRSCSPATRQRLHVNLEEASAHVDELYTRVQQEIKSEIKVRRKKKQESENFPTGDLTL